MNSLFTCPECPVCPSCKRCPAPQTCQVCPRDDSLLIACLIMMNVLLLFISFASRLRDFLEWLTRQAEYLWILLVVLWILLAVLVMLHMRGTADLGQVLEGVLSLWP